MSNITFNVSLHQERTRTNGMTAIFTLDSPGLVYVDSRRSLTPIRSMSLINLFPSFIQVPAKWNREVQNGAMIYSFMRKIHSFNKWHRQVLAPKVLSDLDPKSQVSSFGQSKRPTIYSLMSRVFGQDLWDQFTTVSLSLWLWRICR